MGNCCAASGKNGQRVQDIDSEGDAKPADDSSAQDAEAKKHNFRERRLSISQMQAADGPKRRLSIYGSEEPGPAVKPTTVPNELDLTCACASWAGLEPVPGGTNSKINQDRAIAVYPFPNKETKAVGLFGVYDGHGKQGEKTSQFVVDNLPAMLAQHPEFLSNPGNALIESYLKVRSQPARVWWCPVVLSVLPQSAGHDAPSRRCLWQRSNPRLWEHSNPRLWHCADPRSPRLTG
jgi:hypothetical protein